MFPNTMHAGLGPSILTIMTVVLGRWPIHVGTPSALRSGFLSSGIRWMTEPLSWIASSFLALRRLTYP